MFILACFHIHMQKRPNRFKVNRKQMFIGQRFEKPAICMGQQLCRDITNGYHWSLPNTAAHTKYPRLTLQSTLQSPSLEPLPLKYSTNGDKSM